MTNFRSSSIIDISLISLTLFSHVAFAEITLPSKNNPPLIGVIAKKQPDSELSILGFTIGKSTLGEVKSKFKSTDIYHQGDAGNSLYVLCYKSSNSSTIAFESGEMGGSAHIIDSISINSTKGPYHLNQICQKTTFIKNKFVINGISLGMSPDLVKRLKGKPGKESANSILYQFVVQEKNDKGQVDIISNLEMEFNQDIVSAIKASKMATY